MPTPLPGEEQKQPWPALLQLMRANRGAQLLEFALVLPLLAVISIGVLDFGQAYNLKHYITNAAREAARVTVSNPVTLLGCSGPCGVYAAADAARQYLVNANLTAAACITANAPTSSGTLTWTWSCSGVTLTINRGFSFLDSNGHLVSSTQVTLQYPYTWTFGRIIGLFVSGASIGLPTTLTTTFVMQNLI